MTRAGTEAWLSQYAAGRQRPPVTLYGRAAQQRWDTVSACTSGSRAQQMPYLPLRSELGAVPLVRPRPIPTKAIAPLVVIEVGGLTVEPTARRRSAGAMSQPIV